VNDPLLSVRQLSVTYGSVRALDDVSFEVQPGEAIGVVGESGCGKSTLLRSLLRVLAPSAQVSGQAEFRGRDLLALREEELRLLRGGEIGLIVQDPVNALNPAFTIGAQLRRILRLHRHKPPSDGFDAEIGRMLRRVGVDPVGKLNAYPFNFSQGQLQRIMIAAACLSGHVSLLLADEPTTSLDVSVEAQVLQLLRELRSALGLALMLVTHNLALVAEMCDRVLVMYAGRLVEQGTVYDVFERPSHPYTQQLLRAVPTFPHPGGRLYSMHGSGADPSTVRGGGCPFAPRCDRRLGSVCDSVTPPLTATGNDGQLAACHLYPPEQPVHG
jgi:oligopeptide/dipeptide ABC transporter ATP-binding protein